MKRPKYTPLEGIRAGTAMHRLADEHRTVLETRVEPGRIDGLATDVAEMRGDTEKTASAQQTKLSVSATQEKSLVDSTSAASSIREAVRRCFPKDRDIQKLFGVGREVKSKTVESVAGALQSILDAAEQKPEAARQAGILPTDIAEVRALRDRLVAVDAELEGKKLSAKQATAKRVATQLRVEEAMDRIYAAAVLVFRNKPEILTQFESVMPKSSKGRKTKKAAPAEEPKKD